MKKRLDTDDKILDLRDGLGGFSGRTLVLAWLIFCLTSVDAEDRLNKKQVLLKSGKILEGRTTSFRNETRIDLDDQNYILIPSSRIDRLFSTKKDLVNYKVAITPMKPVAQSQLLQWLYRNGFPERVRSQLIEIRHSQVDMDHQLWAKRLSQSPIRGGVEVPNSRVDVQNKRVHRPDKMADLQKAAEVEFQRRFASGIQNHLLLGCGISGCHDATADSRFFVESELGHPVTAVQTDRNYEVLLEYVSENGPQEFLKFVSNQHGGLRTPIYYRSSTAYLQIATWTNGLAKNLRLKKPQRVGVGQVSDGKTLKTIPPIGKRDPKVIKGNADSGFPRLPSISSSPVGAIGDEFDPEIFNRIQTARWAKARQTTSDQESRLSPPKLPSRLISPDSTRSRN